MTDWNKEVDILKPFESIVKGFKSIFKGLLSFNLFPSRPKRRGGFTPRREVSRISRARFDDVISSLNRMSDEDRWAMEAYELAERTGLWDTNMADGPCIDGEPNIKIERERK